ncbi:hypothetical protein BKA64DRAFT_714585 [Cadophora sp. MPI-SDFR-AT-0126]|nr:hypothetical protein BKA64DRAFT_714585 [Leotiomycetes sp. MPI-SDFR-AT-0126]
MKFQLLLVFLASLATALPSAPYAPGVASTMDIEVREVPTSDLNIVKGRAESVEDGVIISRQNRRDSSYLPTPLQVGASYRLLGGVTFTVIEAIPGIIRFSVHNVLTRVATASVQYNDAGAAGFANVNVGLRDTQPLEVHPSRSFTGTLEIVATAPPV